MTERFGFADAEIGDALADAWERNADFIASSTVPVQGWLVEHLQPQRGETVLELAAGPGDTGFEVAKQLEPRGRLVSSDISPKMIEAARRRAERFGVTNVDFRVMDAQRIEAEDSSFDGVIHRFGPMLLPDPIASFAEVHRVLRDGGRYVAATFGGPQDNQWMTLVAMSVMQSGVELPPGANPMGPGGPFSLSDPDAVREQVRSVGFDDIDVEPVDLKFEFADLDEAWGRLSTLAGPLALLIGSLPDEEHERVKSAFVAGGDQFASDGRYRIPGQALCLIAR